MIKFLAKTAGVIVLLILFMVFIKNPLETSVGIAVMGGWIGLMFTPHFRREMKNGRTFKQICKEDVFVFNGSYQHNHNAFDHQAHARRMLDAHYNNAHNIHVHHPVSTSSWVNDPAYSNLSGNIYNTNYKY
jgi:hypothetical protein